MNFRTTFTSVAIAAALLLSGCATTIPVNYAPSSTMSIKGGTAVGDFAYLPAASGAVKPNQIRNTAIGNAMFEQNIDAMFRDAVFKELRFVGVDVNDPDTHLTGEIQEFLIDDLGYSIDWTIRTKYTVTGADGMRYEAVKETKRNTNKFVNVFGALNETIKLNIESALQDPQFLAAIQ